MLGSWLHHVSASVLSKRSTAVVVAGSVIIIWRIWAGNYGAQDLIYVTVVVGLLTTLPRIGDTSFVRYHSYTDPLAQDADLRVLAGGLAVFAIAWTMLGLTGENDWLAVWLDSHVHKLDSNLILTTEIALVLSIYLFIIEVLLAHNLLYLPGNKANGGQRVVHEAAWLLALITAALLPAAFEMSWLANVIAAVAVPLLVLWARTNYEGYRKAREDEEKPETDSESEETPSARGKNPPAGTWHDEVVRRMRADGISAFVYADPVTLGPYARFHRLFSWIAALSFSVLLWINFLIILWTAVFSAKGAPYFGFTQSFYFKVLTYDYVSLFLLRTIHPGSLPSLMSRSHKVIVINPELAGLSPPSSDHATDWALKDDASKPASGAPAMRRNKPSKWSPRARR